MMAETARKAITRHRDCQKYRFSILSASLSDSMATVFTVKDSYEEYIVLSAELMMVYHGTMHHHSYLSMDCFLKPLPITRMSRFQNYKENALWNQS